MPSKRSVSALMAAATAASLTQPVSAPMSETKKMFLYEIDDKIAGKYPYHSALSGKWVLFYRKSSMDRVWQEVCKLYRDEKLEGIEFLQASTARFINRLKDSDMGMLSFICGPCDEEELVYKYGKELLESLHHLHPFDVNAVLYMACGAAGSTDDGSTVLERIIPREWRSEAFLTVSRPALTTKNDAIGSPMSETEEEWLYEFDRDTEEKYPYDESESGKWMLFYVNESMDNMWASACGLYRGGELTGVRHMKVSTAKYSPRQSSDTTGVIIFYCCPSSNRDLMTSYGKCILEKMSRFGPFDMNHMPYKTDAQTRLGTRATGNPINSIYSLLIPKECRSKNCPTSDWNSDVTTVDVPSEVLDKDWLLERREDISSKWSCVSVGYWLLVYEEPWLDRAWIKLRDLYRAERLIGIQSISANTAKMMNSSLSDGRKKMGFINCFCGPVDDTELVMTYGENLAKLMSYNNDGGTMNFKFKKEILCQVKLSNYWHPKKRGSTRPTSSVSYTLNDVRRWREQ